MSGCISERCISCDMNGLPEDGGEFRMPLCEEVEVVEDGGVTTYNFPDQTRVERRGGSTVVYLQAHCNPDSDHVARQVEASMLTAWSYFIALIS